MNGRSWRLDWYRHNQDGLRKDSNWDVVYIPEIKFTDAFTNRVNQNYPTVIFKDGEYCDGGESEYLPNNEIGDPRNR